MKIYQQVIISLLVTIIILGIGFVWGNYVGNKNVVEKVVTNTVYIPSDPIIDSIPIPYPVKEIIPPDTLNIIKKCVEDGIYTELFPTKIIEDTVYIKDIDTTEIIKDWATTRYYTEILFDVDTLGKCEINSKVQYNRLSDLSYNYTPVIKYEQSLYTRKKAISPFIGAGLFTNPSISGQVGIFINDDWGVSFLYNRDFITKSNNYGITCLYKF